MILTEKQKAWAKYKTDRRQARKIEQRAIQDRRELMLAGHLMRQVIHQERRFNVQRAVARNALFRRPATGNRRAHHRKAKAA